MEDSTPIKMSFEEVSRRLNLFTPFIAITGVALSLVVAVILYTMAPYTQRMALADQKIDEVKAEVIKNEQEHQNFATDEKINELDKRMSTRFDDLAHRTDLVSGRLDVLINSLTKK